MSVIVKGMHMPTSCELYDGYTGCPLFFYDDGDYPSCRMNEGGWINKREIPEWCPLEEAITCAECKYATMTVDGFCKYCEQEADDCGYMDAKYYPGDHYCGSGGKK